VGRSAARRAGKGPYLASQRLSGACLEGAGVGVAANGLTVGGACAPPVVVDELREGGALAVIETGLVKSYTSIATMIAAMAPMIQGRIASALMSCSRLSRRSSSGCRGGLVGGSTGL
jgi:hypothetical protein